MRMAFWFVVFCAALTGGLYFAHTMGWIDVQSWVRTIEDLFDLRLLRVEI